MSFRFDDIISFRYDISFRVLEVTPYPFLLSGTPLYDSMDMMYTVYARSELPARRGEAAMHAVLNLVEEPRSK
jgi:hypothetical protein